MQKWGQKTSYFWIKEDRDAVIKCPRLEKKHQGVILFHFVVRFDMIDVTWKFPSLW